MQVNHVSFTVDSLDRTIGLFTSCLGASLKSRAHAANPRGIPVLTGVADAQVEFAFLDLGGVTIELVQYHEPETKGQALARPCDRGFAHLAINVPALDPVAERLQACGLQPVGGIIQMLGGPDKGKRALYLRDIDGLTLELIGS